MIGPTMMPTPSNAIARAHARRRRVEKDGLSERSEGRAEYALERAKHDDLADRSRQAARHRSDDETERAQNEQAPHAESRREPAGGGRQNRGRDDARGRTQVS